MIARDLMNSDFPFVTVDADLDYVAKLLADCGLGAVPVIDERRALIGIVTRSNLEKAQNGANGADLGEIPKFLLRDRPRPAFHGNGYALRDVMTAPVISVPARAGTPEVARLMESQHLKRLPVLDGDKMIGLLLRADVMDAMRGGAAISVHERRPIISLPHESNHCAIASADEFRELVQAHERLLDAERVDAHRQALAARDQQIRELAQRRLTDSQWREMLAQARRNAQAGLTESLLVRFPAQLCSDGGRAINAPDSRWPETLRGEPADVFRRWRNELHPRGFKIAAQIVDFPDGMPGDAALFLLWSGSG